MRKPLTALLFLAVITGLAHAVLNITYNGSVEMPTPMDVFISSEKTIYITDTGANEKKSIVWTYTANETEMIFQNRFGSFGDGPYQFSGPYGIYSSPQKTLYIADRGNARVQVYKGGSTLEESLGTQEGSAYDFNDPRDVFADAGKVYVTDSLNDRLLVFNDTTFILTDMIGGSPTVDDRLLKEPTGVFVQGGKIYIADTGKNRIAIFSTDLNYLGSAGRSGDVQLNRPEAVFVDGSGKIWVSDTGNNRVVIYWSDLTPYEVIGTNDTESNFSFKEPRGIAFDGGHLYVADSGNGLVKRFIVEEVSSIPREQALTMVSQGDALIQKAQHLNETASKLNIYPSEEYESWLGLSDEQMGRARYAFDTGDYDTAYEQANASKKGSEIAITVLTNTLTKNAFAEMNSSKNTLTRLKAETQSYNLTLDFSEMEKLIEAADLQIKQDDFDAASQTLYLAHIEAQSIENKLGLQTTQTKKLREDAEQNIAEADSLIANITSLAGSHNQTVNITGINVMLEQAKIAFQSYDFATAESAGAIAVEQARLQYAVIHEISIRVDKARDSIRDAEKALKEARGKEDSYLAPNLEEAQMNLDEAKAILYTDPDESMKKAITAKNIAERENASMGLIQPLLAAGMAAVILLAVIGVLLFVYNTILAGKQQPAQKEERASKGDKEKTKHAHHEKVRRGLYLK